MLSIMCPAQFSSSVTACQLRIKFMVGDQETVAFSCRVIRLMCCRVLPIRVMPGPGQPLVWPPDLGVLLIVVVLPLLPSSNWTIGVTPKPATVIVVHRPPVRGRVVRRIVILVNDDGALVVEFRQANFLQGFRNLKHVRLRGPLGQFAIQLCGIIKFSYWTAHSLFLFASGKHPGVPKCKNATRVNRLQSFVVIFFPS